MLEIDIVNQTLEQIKNKPILHQESINELYIKNSVNHLNLLSALILTDKFFDDKPYIGKYLDEKIESIEKEESLKLSQLQLDVKSKKRQVNAFWPLLILTFISGICTIFFSYQNWSKGNNDRLKTDTMRVHIKQLEKLVLNLTQTKMADSMRTATTQTPDITTVK
ncbi:MAG: hypothetical protein ACK50A_16805 [Sphingobacteriaceae bacterium]